MSLVIPKMSAQRHLDDLAKMYEDPSRACSLHELRKERLEFGKAEPAGFLWDREMKRKKLCGERGPEICKLQKSPWVRLNAKLLMCREILHEARERIITRERTSTGKLQAMQILKLSRVERHLSFNLKKNGETLRAFRKNTVRAHLSNRTKLALEERLL